MSSRDEYTNYALLAQLDTQNVQNPQDMASMWGEITNLCDEIGVSIEQSYAALGQFDFLVIVDAQSRDLVLKAALIMERHGLDVQTMGIFPTEQFAEIVSDL